MKNSKIHTLAFFLFLMTALKAQENLVIPRYEKDLPFASFVIEAESALPVKFFYREEWIRNIKVNADPGCNTLKCILDRAFAGTSIYYIIEPSGNIVLTKDFAVRLPGDAGPDYLEPDRFESRAATPETEGKTVIEIGDPAEKYRHGNVIISGYIRDLDTHEPLPGVTVFIRKLSIGSISNEFGYFTLSAPRGSQLLQFSSIGMKEKSVPVNVNGKGELNVDMKAVITPLKEVIVSAEKNVTLQRFEVGVEKMNMITFKLLPTLMGESDLLKSVLLIPGVQSVGEASAGFNVRGGAADQNLVLLYGAPVYNTSHFFGFFSAVNSDVIRDITLYKGGIPSRYGGRISSVLDIGTREGNRKEFKGSAGISPITTHLMVEGPLKKDTLTYLLTARTTYSNWILGFIRDPTLQHSKASFYDLNGKIAWDINKKNRVAFSAYYSHDEFKFNTDTIYGYNNRILAIHWRHFFSSTLISSFSLNNSAYRYNISSPHAGNESFELIHKVNSTGLNADFNWFKGKHELNFGSNMIRYGIDPGSYLPYGSSSHVVPDEIPHENAWEGSVYLEDKFMFTKFLSMNAGIRMSGFMAMGPRSVLIYNPESPRSISTVMDTIVYGKGNVLSHYVGPEYRISMNFRITENNSFKINYNRTRQYIHLLSNSTSISPTDTWKLSDYYLKPQVGDQIAAGFYEIFANNRYEASAEVYYKGIRNMVDFKGGTNLVMDRNVEKDIINMKGRAYGIELLFKKNEGRIRYSVGYTFSRTLVKSRGSFDQDNINEGKWYPASFDKPHDLVVVFNYIYSRRFSFTTNYVYSTGRPITFPVATYILYENQFVHYSERNKYRIPDYSRLDISMRLNGNLRSHKIAHPYWTFSVYNVLSRKNAYSVFFKREGEVIKGYKLSIFGRAIPSVTFNFDF